MSWFTRLKKGFRGDRKIEAEDVWDKCEGCGDVIYTAKLPEMLWLCPKCGHHFPISARNFINILFDKDDFIEENSNITSTDPLRFRDSKKYSDRLKDARSVSGEKSAIITGTGKMDGISVAAGVMEFKFVAGSLGCAMGEKIARLVDTAIIRQLPLIIVSRSGGARMQESAFSLMQMAKTAAKIGQMHDTGLPYISVLSHPTTGGTTASFAMLGDIHIAEPGALIGFAGPRVIEATIQRSLPEGFQRSEFVMEHGFVDMIVPRRELKSKIVSILTILGYGKDAQKENSEKASMKDRLVL